jgi:hypothetical protein
VGGHWVSRGVVRRPRWLVREAIKVDLVAPAGQCTRHSEKSARMAWRVRGLLELWERRELECGVESACAVWAVA